MDREGRRLTSFYVTSGVCTPSRASLLTGCYPRRVGLHETDGAVLRPVSRHGLDPREVTVAEVLKARGYATALVGKWHLGDQPPFLPTRQGFDSYLGIPYSDDMTPREGKPWPPLPLLRDEKVIEAPVDRSQLTRRYTEECLRFIRSHRERPFFLLLAHAMPGSTRRPFSSERFRGQSAGGPWGDAVEEIDWSTGEILAALKELGLERETLVIWTSDNGAPRRSPTQGSNRPLRGWGYTTAEGGMRVPCVVRWPGRVPAGTSSDEVATTLDVLPTFARLAGAALPEGRRIDGKDIGALLLGEEGARSPHRAFYYYHLAQLQAVRSGEWKLYLPLERKLSGLRGAARRFEAELYDLRADVGETVNLAARQPAVVERLMRLAEEAREDLGDLGREGKGQRPRGTVLAASKNPWRLSPRFWSQAPAPPFRFQPHSRRNCSRSALTTSPRLTVSPKPRRK